MIESGRARPQQRNFPKPKHRFQFNQFRVIAFFPRQSSTSIDLLRFVTSIRIPDHQIHTYFFRLMIDASDIREFLYFVFELKVKWRHILFHSSSILSIGSPRSAHFDAWCSSRNRFSHCFFFVDRCVHKLVHIRQRNMCVIFFLFWMGHSVFVYWRLIRGSDKFGLLFFFSLLSIFFTLRHRVMHDIQFDRFPI